MILLLQTGRRPEFAKNPFSRQNVTVNGEANRTSAVMAAPAQSQIQSSSMVALPPSQFLSHHGAMSTNIPEKRARLEVPYSNQNASEIYHSKHRFQADNLPLPNLSYAAPLASNVNQASLLVTQQASYPVPPIMSRQTHPYPSMIPEPRASTPLWIDRQGAASSSNSYGNHNNYDVYGRPLQAQMQQPGPVHNRNGRMVNQWYESWSPNNSPTRSQPGRNYIEPSINMDPSYSYPRPRPRNPPEFGDIGRNDNRRWHDQRR